MINEFRGKYYFLSNFYIAPFSYKGITYLNAEAAFQSAKCVKAEDRQKFKSLSPNEAKWLGRKVFLRPDWETYKFGIMREVVRAKFEQNPDLAQKLLDTDPEYLVEGNYWHDNIYGDCNFKKCQDIKGKNVIGKILMEERAYLKKERAKIRSKS